LAIFVDSAQLEDARRAQELGFVRAITTNPALVAKTGRAGLAVLADLLDIFDGPVFYQVTADTPEGRLNEAWEAYQLRPDRVVIKIPATTDNIALVSKLAGIDVAVTAAFSAAQALLAAEAGARYVALYVHRAARLLGDGIALVRETAAVLDGTGTEIVAASLKSTEEVVAARRAGAHHLTLPMALIEALGEHDLTQQSIKEFAQALQPT
jgi:transaldolase